MRKLTNDSTGTVITIQTPDESLRKYLFAVLFEATEHYRKIKGTDSNGNLIMEKY